MVSEIMLQQTQVERVIPLYAAFLAEFPTIEALAKAPLARVLTRWQGLGYNRRAKMLHDAAKAVVRDYKGRMPRTVSALDALPGVGHYTARAVAAFAFNEDVVLIETNVRTAVTHHFFLGEEKVSDKDILPILDRALPRGDARRWYAALMDYGAFLKRSGIRINARNASYTKQKTFKGSDREARGLILKALSLKPATQAVLRSLASPDRGEQLQAQLAKLVAEGLVEKQGTRYQLPS